MLTNHVNMVNIRQMAPHVRPGPSCKVPHRLKQGIFSSIDLRYQYSMLQLSNVLVEISNFLFNYYGW